MRDHDPIVTRQFLGTYSRGDDDSVPPGYFKDSRNIRFISGGVKSREGTSLDVTIGSVKRMAIYKRIGEAQRLLLLDGAGNLYDSTNLVTPILSIVAMTDFSVEVMFDRAYITPHDGVTGLPGEKVYVYNGSGLARPAAGSAPTGGNLTAADSVASGNCETGTHVFAVCFETASGHLTAPGGFVAFSPAGGKKVDLGNILVGPAGTVARQILATKEIIDFNGDFQNQEYFQVPNGRIADNATTTLSVSFYDADLQASMDYLLDQLATIPAGVGILNYRGRLVVWGENANPSIARVSKSGYPESHDSVEGYITVNPGDSGGGILNAAEYRNQILFFKDERTYATQDNGENAAFWNLGDAIDSSVGSSSHGVARVRDFGKTFQDRLFVASRPGIQLFAGTYAEAVVSLPVEAIWSRITAAYFHTIEMVLDPVDTLLYCALPLDGATSPNYVLVADFQEGLDNIKWTLWSFGTAPTTIVVDVNFAAKTSVFKYGSSAGNVNKLDTTTENDLGVAKSAFVQLAHWPQDDDGNIYHFTGIRVRVRGVGNLDLYIEGEDAVQTATPASLVMALAPGRELFRGFSFSNEKCSVKFSIDGANEKFTVTKVALYQTIEWETRPE